MPIAHQSSATGTGGAGSSTLTITKPTGTVAGDVLVAGLTLGGGAHVSAPPAGWVAIVGGGAAETFAAYYKVAGGSEPASYTWTLDALGGGAGGISRYSGVDNVTPLDVAGTSTFGFSSPATAGPITTVTANAMLVGGVFELSVYTVTPPAGLTERWEAGPGNNVGNEHASGIQATAGSTGVLSWPMSSSTTSRGWVSALREATSAQVVGFGTGIASAEVVGMPTIAATGSAPPIVLGAGIPSAEVVGQPTVSQISAGTQTIVFGTGIPSAEHVGQPTVSMGSTVLAVRVRHEGATQVKVRDYPIGA